MLARQLKEGSGYLHGERCAFLAIALADAITTNAMRGIQEMHHQIVGCRPLKKGTETETQVPPSFWPHQNSNQEPRNFEASRGLPRVSTDLPAANQAADSSKPRDHLRSLSSTYFR